MSRHHIKQIGRKYKVYWFNELSAQFLRKKDAINHADKLNAEYLATSSAKTKPQVPSEEIPTEVITEATNLAEPATTKPKPQQAKPAKSKSTKHKSNKSKK